MSVKIFIQNHETTGDRRSTVTTYTEHLLYQSDGNWEYAIEAPKLKLEINKAGSLEFSIYPNNPYYGIEYLKKMQTVVRVEIHQNGRATPKVLFRGRILDIKTNMFKVKKVTCEGDLNFLLDSVMSHDEWRNVSPAAALGAIVTAHNARQINYGKWKLFEIGKNYLSGTSDQYFDKTEFSKCSDVLDSQLIQPYGGIIRTRYEPHETNGVHYEAYLDYLPDPVNDPTNYNNEFHAWEDKIRFGVNVVDYDHSYPSNEIFTALWPLGHDNLKVYIQGDDGGIYSQIVNWDTCVKFGVIDRVETWNEITNGDKLLAEGTKFLNHHGYFDQDDYTITAVDLVPLDPTNTDPIELGDRVKFVCKPAGVDINLICLSIEYDFQNPDKTVYKIGNFIPADKHKGSGKNSGSSRGGSGSSGRSSGGRRSSGGSSGVSSTVGSLTKNTETPMHYHDIDATAQPDGKVFITLGAVTTQRKETNFNIADTQFYKNGVSAAVEEIGLIKTNSVFTVGKSQMKTYTATAANDLEIVSITIPRTGNATATVKVLNGPNTLITIPRDRINIIT